MNWKTILVLLLFLPLFATAQKEDERDPTVTELHEPVPPKVTPGKGTAAPSDAIVLFDGSSFDEWEHEDGRAVEWKMEAGAMTVVGGTKDIRTKREFGDIQLHIEFRTPKVVESEGQGRGNSGVFLQSRYEVQVLDNYDNYTYPNGQAGALYKQYIPLVNACKPPGEWQTYDIIFRAPRFSDNGRVIIPAEVTVLHNGILIQNGVELLGDTPYRGLPTYKKHGKAPLKLQDHGNPVSYRNIWVREL